MKTYYVLFLLLAALMLTSCGKNELHYLDTTTSASEETPAPETYPYTPSDNREPYGNPKNIATPLQAHDGYLYVTVGNGMDQPIELIRYNCANGNATAVCPDPLCDHADADCPLFGMRGNNMFVVGEDGCIYFDAMTWSEGKANYFVLQFDAQRGKTQTLVDFGDTYGRSPECYTEDYCFTMGGYWDEAGENYTTCVMRRDLRTQVSKPLFEVDQKMGEDYSYAYNILFIAGDRLYLSDLTCVFSVNFDGGDRRVHFEGRGDWQSRTDGTYMYYCDAEGELCRRALDGNGAEEHLGIYPYDRSFHLTEDFICYRTGESVTLGKARILGYASDTVVLEAGEVRVCDLDGGNDRLLYRFEGETASIRPVHGVVVGNYYYCTYLWWDDPDGDGIYRDGADQYSWAANGKCDCDLLRIDLSTGELYRIHIE